MKISDIPEYKDKRQILMLDKQITVFDAAKKMKELNYGAALVTENGKLSGIFTERDLLMKIAAQGKEISGVKLADVMTSPVKTAHIDDTVYDSMRRMSQGRFRHLPVVDNNGEITGLISQGDFVAITWYQLFQQLKTQTKSSFMTFTQLWILVICLIGYFTAMLLFTK